jgi:hypothetical protein
MSQMIDMFKLERRKRNTKQGILLIDLSKALDIFDRQLLIQGLWNKSLKKYLQHHPD